MPDRVRPTRISALHGSMACLTVLVQPVSLPCMVPWHASPCSSDPYLCLAWLYGLSDRARPTRVSALHGSMACLTVLVRPVSLPCMDPWHVSPCSSDPISALHVSMAYLTVLVRPVSLPCMGPPATASALHGPMACLIAAPVLVRPPLATSLPCTHTSDGLSHRTPAPVLFRI